VQSFSQIITTNKPTPKYFRPDAFLLPSQQSQSTEGKIELRLPVTSCMDCSTYIILSLIYPSCIMWCVKFLTGMLKVATYGVMVTVDNNDLLILLHMCWIVHINSYAHTNYLSTVSSRLQVIHGTVEDR